MRKHRIQVLTEQDIARMDEKRKPQNFFAFVRAVEADSGCLPPKTSDLSSGEQKQKISAFESLKSAFEKGIIEDDTE